MRLTYIISFLVFGFVNADTNSIINNFSSLTPNLPLSGLSEDSAKQYFQDKCRNQTNDDKIFDKILEGKNKIQECFQTHFNISNLPNEIEAAKPTGDLDVVFGKYCRKIPTLTTCVKDFYKIVEPCLNEKEKEGYKVAHNITLTIIDFLCFKDGDRIALFIAEEGIECVQSKQNEIQNCLKEHINTNITTITTEIPSKETQCNVLANLQTCVVKHLEKCKEPTPANLIEALFKYVQKLRSCPKKN